MTESANQFTGPTIVKINRRQFQLSSLAAVGLVGFSGFETKDQLSKTALSQADWPQWGGDRRDFCVAALAGGDSLPTPELNWRRRLGKGHSAIVTSGEFGYSLHLDDEHEVLEKWRLDSGKRVWNFRYKVGYHASFPEYDGPHATPIALKDRIITAGIDAQVHSIDTSKGDLLWKRDLRADYGTSLPQSGYACSPIVWEDRVIFPTLGESRPAETESYEPSPKIPQGRKAIPGAIALDIRTGDEVWRTKTFRSSHGSPIQIEVDDQPMLVFHGMFELVGVDPRNGKILWKQLLRRQAADNVSFTPIWNAEHNQLLVAHGYCNFGAQAIRLEKSNSRWRTSINWRNPRLQIVHTNAVLMGNILLGTRRPSATLLVAIDVRDGKTVFRQRGFGKSNLLAVGSQLIILDESGDLVGGKLTDEGVSELWRIQALSKTAWTVPTMSGRRLLLRDSTELKAFQLP